MSRGAYLALTAAGCLLLHGCQPTKPGAYRIAVIPKGLTHEHWQSVHRGALRAASDLAEQGIPTEIVWDGPLRERDALAQIRIVDRRISTHVDGIVLAPQHSQTMVAPVKRAVEEGIPVVVIDSGLEVPELYIKYVATDNFNGGYLAGKHLIRVLRDDGRPNPRLILFRYAVGSESTEQREAGFETYIEEEEKAGRLHVTWLSNDKYAGATKDSALKEAAPLVNRFRDQIDGIFAPNESSASGMLDALRSLGLVKTIHFMGFDSSDPLLNAVADGEMDGLILQDPYKMGYLSVWVLVRYLKGDDVAADGKVLGTGEHVITRANLDDVSTIELFNAEAQGKRVMTPPKFPRRR